MTKMFLIDSTMKVFPYIAGKFHRSKKSPVPQDLESANNHMLRLSKKFKRGQTQSPESTGKASSSVSRSASTRSIGNHSVVNRKVSKSPRRISSEVAANHPVERSSFDVVKRSKTFPTPSHATPRTKEVALPKRHSLVISSSHALNGGAAGPLSATDSAFAQTRVNRTGSIRSDESQNYHTSNPNQILFMEKSSTPPMLPQQQSFNSFNGLSKSQQDEIHPYLYSVSPDLTIDFSMAEVNHFVNYSAHSFFLGEHSGDSSTSTASSERHMDHGFHDGDLYNAHAQEKRVRFAPVETRKAIRSNI